MSRSQCLEGTRGSASKAVAILIAYARVPEGLPAKPSAGIQKHGVSKNDRAYTKFVPQCQPRSLVPVGYHYHDGSAFCQHIVQHLSD